MEVSAIRNIAFVGHPSAGKTTFEWTRIDRDIHYVSVPNLPASVRIPPGSFYVLADNSPSSEDSRQWGFLPEDHLEGKVILTHAGW